MNLIRFGAALLCCCLAACPAPAAETPDQLTAAARDGNRAAIRAIQTMECRYDCAPCPGTTADETGRVFSRPWGQFWRSGDTFRTLARHRDWEYVVRGGRMYELSHHARGPNRAAVSVSTPHPVYASGGDVWQYLLFSHWGPGPASYHTLDELLRHRPTIRAAERLPSGEIHLTLSHSGANWQEFWLDPKVNYLVRKCVCVPADHPTWRWEHEVVEFAEPAKSVFVPSVVEVRYFLNDARQAADRTRVTELKVNHPLPESSLRLTGAAGVMCLDWDRKVEYALDADLNPVGPVKAVRVDRSTRQIVASSLAGAEPSGPHPAEWWRWPAALSAVAVAGLVALAIMRRAGAN